MSNAQIERMQENLKTLKLYKINDLLESTLEEASKNNLPYSDFLDNLLSEEVSSKKEKNIAMRTSMAKFPFIKTLESFDFNFQLVEIDLAVSQLIKRFFRLSIRRPR